MTEEDLGNIAIKSFQGCLFLMFSWLIIPGLLVLFVVNKLHRWTE